MVDLLSRLDTWISLVGIALVGYLWIRRRWRSLMSRSAPTQESSRRTWERRSYAAEQPTEPPGTAMVEPVPATAEPRDLVAAIEQLDDNELLDLLARVTTANGYRFADSRIAKFIGGRVEDRLAQVRAVRGVEPPAPPGRVLSVNGGERMIPFEGKR